MEQGALLFEAVIVPHRSLSRRGLRVLLLVICVLCCASATLFVRLGAWPIGGFTGVELALAAYLFHLNMRAARATELVMLTGDSLRIIRTDPAGRRRERVLAPSWLSVRLEDRPGRVPALHLVARGVEEEIGRVLGETEKRDLAQALEAALERLRNPRFDNPQLRS